MKLAFTLLLTAAGCLIVICASTWEIEYDEAWSLARARGSSFCAIMLHEPAYANNHLINSIWMKLCSLAGAKSMLVFRGITVASAIVILFWIWKDFRESAAFGVALVVFILTSSIFFPYLVWARGYGFSICLSIVSIRCLAQFAETGDVRQKAFSIAAAILAAASNLAFSFLLVSVTICAFTIDYRRMLTVYRFVPEATATAVSVFFFLPIGRRVADFDAYIPGTNRVYDVAASLVSQQVGYSPSVVPLLVLKIGVICASTIIAAGIIVSLAKSAERRKVAIAFFLAALCAVLYLVSNKILGTKMPMGRGAMPLSVCLLMAAAYSRCRELIDIGLIILIASGLPETSRNIDRCGLSRDHQVAAAEIKRRFAKPVLIGQDNRNGSIMFYLDGFPAMIKSIIDGDASDCDVLLLSESSVAPEFEEVPIGLRHHRFFLKRPSSP